MAVGHRARTAYGVIERGASMTLHATKGPARSGAVTWIDRQHAVVATTTPNGSVDVKEIAIPVTEGGELSALAQVAEQMGDHARVVILGPDEMRLALEREYVSLYRRPDLIVDVRPEGLISQANLIDFLHDLTA
jgi:hypothetical protein